VNANRAEERWVAFADPTRRQIVARLVARPQAVGELASQLPVSRSAVSQHLRVLKDAGLVSERAEGTRRIYAVNPAALEALRDQIDTYWRRALEGYSDLFASDNNA
jgi:DNA-binding transcriptional ArsR family regulator